MFCFKSSHFFQNFYPVYCQFHQSDGSTHTGYITICTFCVTTIP